MAEIEETVYTDETVYTTEVIVDAGSAGHEVVLADMDNVRAHHIFHEFCINYESTKENREIVIFYLF